MLQRGIAERIAGLLGISLVDLVRSLGGEPVSLDAEGPGRTTPELLVVLVEFGNEQVQGLVGLLAEPRLFSRLSPRIRLDSPRYVEDWACEFANQAVGRFRNHMRAYGPLVTAKPPQLAKQEDMRLTEARPMRMAINLGVEDMVLSAWIDLDGQPSLPMSDGPDEELVAGMPDHGEVLLF